MPDINEAPYEVMYGPCEVWIYEDTDEAIPGLGAVVGGNWRLLGASGDDAQTEDGLAFASNQTHAQWSSITKALPLKDRRQSQEAHIRFVLADARVDTMQWGFDSAFDLVDVTGAGAGSVGHKDILFEMTPNVQLYSLLVRWDQSPYGHRGPFISPVWRSQAYFPAVYAAGNPEQVWRKSGEPAGFAFDFMPMSGAEFTNKPQIQQVHAGQLGKAIVSSTDAIPIVVTVTSHGFLNGETVRIYGHEVNTAANGDWVVANKTTHTFELTDSDGNGTGGATGYAGIIS